MGEKYLCRNTYELKVMEVGNFTDSPNGNIGYFNNHFYYTLNDGSVVKISKTLHNKESALLADGKIGIRVFRSKNKIYVGTNRFSGSVVGVRLISVNDLSFSILSNLGNNTDTVEDFAYDENNLYLSFTEFRLKSSDETTFTNIGGGFKSQVKIDIYKNELYGNFTELKKYISGTTWNNELLFTFNNLVSGRLFLYLFDSSNIYKYDGSGILKQIQHGGIIQQVIRPKNITFSNGYIYWINSNKKLSRINELSDTVEIIDTPSILSSIPYLVNADGDIYIWDTSAKKVFKLQESDVIISKKYLRRNNKLRKRII